MTWLASGSTPPASPPVVETRDLSLVAPADREGRPAGIVDRLTLAVGSGETLGIIGESGSGKSMTVYSLAGLLPQGVSVAGGSIRLRGREVTHLPESGWRKVRGRDVGVVFQDSIGNLDPLFTVGYQLVEAMRAVRVISRKAARAEAVRLLENVGIAAPEARFTCYPHELSGGMAQRVAIAIALCNEPALLMADEPTTALDVTLQRRILALFKQVQAQRGCAVIFVSHDLATVAKIADRIAVMYAGQVVECGSTREVIRSPRHPYTIALINSQPRLSATRQQLQAIPGSVPLPGDWPDGCRFHPRCELSAARRLCREATPELFHVGGAGHVSACHFWRETDPTHPVPAEGGA